MIDEFDNRNPSEIITVKIYSEDDYFEDEYFSKISLGIKSVIGTRKTQQDTIFGQFNDTSGIAIVCDGMGGLQGGEKASETAVTMLAEDFFAEEEMEDVPAFFRKEAIKIDEAVSRLCDENGTLLEAGTTMVSVIIQEDKLFWLSIGDSKIYIIRDQEIITVNRLHNYRMTMDQMMQQGTMSEEEYQKKEKHAEALISFLGMGNVSLMDINPQGFELKDKDVILLSSDGLYRVLSDETIQGIVKKHMFNLQDAADALTEETTRRAVKSQDNTSVVLVQYHEEAF